MFIQMYYERYMRFPGGMEKAITFSYDDGVVADKKLIAILDKYGLKGTFNLNSKLFNVPEWHGRMDEEQTINTFKNSGHEVALHGARHIFLGKVPLPLAVKEVADNRAYLEEKFGCIVNGMAYAYSGVDDETVQALKALGVQYARTTVSTHSFAIPSDWLHLNSTPASPRTSSKTASPGCSISGGTPMSSTITITGTSSRTSAAAYRRRAAFGRPQTATYATM